LAVTDVERAPIPTWLDRLEKLCAVCQPGGLMVQLRDRQLPVRQRLEFGRALRRITTQYAQGLLVNDRLDVALLLNADGVHLACSSVTAADARRFAAERSVRFWVSAACHHPEHAGAQAVDALVLSPVISPRKGRAALGPAGVSLARQCATTAAGAGSRCLIYALGGVDAGTAASLVDAGADGVAAIGAILTERTALLSALHIGRGVAPAE
jgi:thiamine-phosphate diphosphorylase